MSSVRRRGRSDRAIALPDLVRSLSDAVSSARRVLDGAKAARPGLALDEVRFVVRFALAEVASSGAATRAKARQVHVLVDAPSLSEIAPHLISEMEVRITRAGTTVTSQLAGLNLPE